MSIPVPVESLRAAIAERGAVAYLLTVSDDGRPHAVHGPLAWDGDELAADVGKRTAANAAARPSVSLLFPVRTDGDYSLIVDGTAAIAPGGDGKRLLITPTKAVLHRPAASPDPKASCEADCVALLGAGDAPGRTR
jgi:Pyridoxamine 5'-phosphate oxidase